MEEEKNVDIQENAEQENTEQNTEKKVTDIIKKAKEKLNKKEKLL